MTHTLEQMREALERVPYFTKTNDVARELYDELRAMLREVLDALAAEREAHEAELESVKRERDGFARMVCGDFEKKVMPVMDENAALRARVAELEANLGERDREIARLKRCRLILCEALAPEGAEDE